MCEGKKVGVHVSGHYIYETVGNSGTKITTYIWNSVNTGQGRTQFSARVM